MKRDCFGFGEKGCRILLKTDCDGCSFYCNKEDYKKSLEKSNKRLTRLPLSTQQYIADKYYDGKKPWLIKK